MLARVFVAVFLITLQCVRADLLADITSALANTPEDGRLNFCELANKYNYSCVRYDVITKDGYILGLYNIEGDRTKPVFLQHGFLDSSDTWLIRGPSSIAALLANNTYDLWFGNMRGNMHSRDHVTLNPDHLKFWEFSFHEIALYDLPAVIDFILEKTGQTQLQVIAHSEGTTLFYVLGSLLPEYCLKIKIVVSLAPIMYMHHAQKPIFPLLSLGGSILSGGLSILGHGELLRNSSELVSLYRIICTQEIVGYAACGVALGSLVYGPDPGQFEPEFTQVAFSHYPCGTSTKNGAHLVQIATAKRFQQYDHGLIGNIIKYYSAKPPLYDLNKVFFKVSLYVGQNDRLSAIEDVDLLREQLPNVVEYNVMEPKEWNHIDFIWGKNMSEFLFNPLLDTLKNNY